MSPCHFDPRTKILLLIFVILSASFATSIYYEAGLILLILLFGLLCGKKKTVLFAAIGTVIMFGLTVLTRDYFSGTLQTAFIAFLGLLHKVYPCSIMASLMISTTKVSEFMATMNRIHLSKQVVIPLAVMLRYMPVIREDLGYIKDAMRMRDVSPNLISLIKHPVMTMECVYAPLMMAASKTADELSIACITRGIENPGKRTCLTTTHFHIADGFAVVGFFAYFLAAFFVKGGVL